LRCSIFILVTNEHNMATLKQSSEANQLTERDETSLVQEAPRSITYHSIPTSTSIQCSARAIPLLCSRTS
jgi:hypothetical protein